MQMYQGYEIITSSPSQEDKENTPHHLYNYLDASGQCTVGDYRDKAREAIEDIRSRGKLPIVVGGTIYYLKHLLWPTLLSDIPLPSEANQEANDETSKGNNEVASKGVDDDTSKVLNEETDKEAVGHIDNEPSTKSSENMELWDKLNKLDPEMAAQLHPNDLRKIKRSIKVFHDYRVKHSELIRHQKRQKIGATPNYDALIYWILRDEYDHEDLLHSRIDAMVAQGLLKEAKAAFEALTTQSFSDHHGVFQAMGHKEFFPYIVDNEDFKSDALLQSCKEELFLHHWKYKKLQERFIKRHLVTSNLPVVDINLSTQLEPIKEMTHRWGQFVEAEAEEFKQFTINSTEHVVERHMQERHDCSYCKKVIFGKEHIESHLNSKRHRRYVKRHENWIRKGHIQG